VLVLVLVLVLVRLLAPTREVLVFFSSASSPVGRP
jgi:hypothetical protein